MPCCLPPPAHASAAHRATPRAVPVLVAAAVPLLLLAGCCRSAGDPPMSASTTSRGPRPRTITIELLALDLSTCGRCTRTQANLDAALRDVATRLRADGITVDVRRTVIRTADDALQHRLASSPTIRVDGRDIALDFRESECSECGELCGCEGGVACRTWLWRGREHLEAPREMIVDALLRASEAPPRIVPSDTTPFTLPTNLARYFAHLEEGAPGTSACCAGSECCEPQERAACCGTVGPGEACSCRK